jgi:hypothetical protein
MKSSGEGRCEPLGAVVFEAMDEIAAGLNGSPRRDGEVKRELQIRTMTAAKIIVKGSDEPLAAGETVGWRQAWELWLAVMAEMGMV